jgi:lysophospholipase L1-like esterase
MNGRAGSGVSRRGFVVAAGGVVGLALLPEQARAAARRADPPPGLTVLFQGDSITDGGRVRSVAEPNRGDALGAAYPFLVAAALLEAHPDRGLRFFNRGVSGDKVPQLEARWQADALDLRPDVVSVLVGVNDFWHTLDGNYRGTADDYERGYAALLARTRQALPGVRLVVIEPFVLGTGVITDAWFPEFDRRRERAARVARQAGATFISAHQMFEQLARRAPAAYWAADGVHPTLAGHAAIANRWLRAVHL